MTPEEAPTGSVAVVGHPDNGVTVTKQDDGRWLFNHNRTNGFSRPALDPEDLQHGGGRLIYAPGVEL